VRNLEYQSHKARHGIKHKADLQTVSEENEMRNIMLAMQRLHSIPYIALLRLLGAEIGADVSIAKSARFPMFNLKQIRISDRVQICAQVKICIPHAAKTAAIIIRKGAGLGCNMRIFAAGMIFIGENVLFSENVHLSDSEHVFDDERGPVESGVQFKGPISIGSNSFVGKNVVVLPGVTLGERCVVGANAVVSKSFPDGSVIGGVPAKLLKRHV